MGNPSIFAKLLSCFAAELNRVEASIIGVINQSVPGLATDLLEEWETDLGLPEDCFPASLSLTERQNAAHAKYTTKYTGLSEQFFIDLAFSLGATISITVSTGAGVPFRANGPVDPDETRVGPFASSSDPAGRVWSVGRLSVWIVTIASSEPNIDIIQCLFEKFKPAHTVVQFIIT